MELSSNGSSKAPHAVMIPYPAQGHINPMMELAKRLLSDGFIVTFVNTTYNHRRMLHAAGSWLSERHHNLRFEHIDDGLPEGHGRLQQDVIETMAAFLTLSPRVIGLLERVNCACPVSCFIADALFSEFQDVADRFSIPRVALWTTPVHANIAYASQRLLMDQGLIPLHGNKEKLSQIVNIVPGIVPLKLEDWISFFLVNTTNDFIFLYFLFLALHRSNEAAWNLGNNFEDLELDGVKEFKKYTPNFIPIGPLLPKYVFEEKNEIGTELSNSLSRLNLFSEATNCKSWLSQHPPSSVLYIAFGNIVGNMAEQELKNLIEGIQASGVPFLWVVREDQTNPCLLQLQENIKNSHSKKGLIVPWAPQLSILTHPSTGAFISHCGWNSILESICAGVPIIARPAGFAEQRMNALYVSDVWKVGVHLLADVTSDFVKKQIQFLFNESTRSSIETNLTNFRKSALNALTPPSGSSYSNYDIFVNDIRRRVNS